ncbi:uncharacterized protein [Dysidea avara]|uniref:uncharacterized protein n=1 Tax=Dysidea avara TaxID=196820 RepID=UPI00332D2F7F
MAHFYGHAPGESFREDQHQPLQEWDISREEFISSAQDGQAALIVCNQMHSELRNLQMQMTTLNNTMEEIKSARPNNNEENSAPKKKLPRKLLGIVKELYSKATNVFNSSELFGSPHNQAVAQELVEQIASCHSRKYTSLTIKRAVHRYYESRRRTYNDSQASRQAAVVRNKDKAKRKGYQRKLYQRRKKMIKTEREMVKWLAIDYQYMTDESCDEDGSVRVHHIPWESDELQKLKADLDQRRQEQSAITGRYVAKPRVESTPSTLPVPINAVKWAVNSTSESDGRNSIANSQSQLTSFSYPDANNPSTSTPQSSLQFTRGGHNTVSPLSAVNNILSTTTPDRHAGY